MTNYYKSLISLVYQGAIRIVATCFQINSYMLRFFVKILVSDKIFMKVIDDVRFKRVAKFEDYWKTLCEKLAINELYIKEKHIKERDMLIHGKKSIRDALLDILCVDNIFYYKDKKIRYSDRSSLWILLNEIIIKEEYYFRCDTDSPRILDCGCHFGLATFYFKDIYPNAKITAFEPIPDVHKLAKENFEINGLDDVDILPFALSEKEGSTTFFVSRKNPMGSSLFNRYKNDNDNEVDEISVECKRLSNYLQEKVHYLKLDIEGSEDIVLSEAEPYLKNVLYIFCEFHNIDKNSNQRLANILMILQRAGFDMHGSKSWTTQLKSGERPMNYVGEPLSHVIWAKNRGW